MLATCSIAPAQDSLTALAFVAVSGLSFGSGFGTAETGFQTNDFAKDTTRNMMKNALKRGVGASLIFAGFHGFLHSSFQGLAENESSYE